MNQLQSQYEAKAVDKHRKECGGSIGDLSLGW